VPVGLPVGLLVDLLVWCQGAPSWGNSLDMAAIPSPETSKTSVTFVT